MSRVVPAALLAALVACSSSSAPKPAPTELRNSNAGTPHEPGAPAAPVQPETPVGNVKPAPPTGCTEATYEVTSLATCTAACDQGGAESCALAGRMLAVGQRIKRDRPRALVLLEKGCERGEGQACFDLASAHSPRKNPATGSTIGWPDVPHDAAQEASYRQRSIEAFQRECDAGRARSCFQLGGVYTGGVLVAQDAARGKALSERSVALWRTGCDADDGLACGELATLYYIGMHVADDDTRALELHTRACELGRAPSCHHAAGQYDIGDGGKKDRARAIALWQRGCDLGHGWSCGHLARMKDDTDLYVKACDMGNGFGCTQAAEKLRASDAARANRLLGACCDREDTQCCRRLGREWRDADAGPR